MEIKEPSKDKSHLMAKKISTNPFQSYFILFLLCLTQITSITIINIPVGIQKYFLESPYSFSNFEYAIFYSGYEVPNFIIPLITGFYLDEKGITSTLLSGISLVLIIGCFIISIGSSYYNLLYMIIGRLILGIGCDNIALIIKKIIIINFEKKDLVLVWGIYLMAYRFGYVISTGVIPLLYEETKSISTIFWISILFALFLVIFLSSAILLSKRKCEKVEFIQINNHLESLKLFYNEEINKVIILYGFLLFITTMMFFGFFPHASLFLSKSMDIENMDSGYYLMIFCSLLSIFQPFFGFLISKTGYLSYYYICASLIILTSFLIFLQLYKTYDADLSIIPLLLISVGYSAASTVFYSLPSLMISFERQGIAYGFFHCIQSFAVFIGPSLFGTIKDFTSDDMDGYFFSFLLEILLTIIMIILVIFMIITDRGKIKGFVNKF